MSGSTSFPSSTNPYTDVGAYSLATSPYGTFDQGGNVSEWNETRVTNLNQGVRGGSFNDNVGTLWADVRSSDVSTNENFLTGFRVATVPEPTTMLLGALASMGMLLLRKR